MLVAVAVTVTLAMHGAGAQTDQCVELHTRIKELRAEIALLDAELSLHCPAEELSKVPFGLGTVGSMAPGRVDLAIQNVRFLGRELSRLQCGPFITPRALIYGRSPANG
jgi:hypothetical protein